MGDTQSKELAPIEVLRKQLTALGPELANALPSHIKPEKFQRVVATVCGLTPELLMADRKSLLGSCMKCAADGLVPDGREAALVIFNTNTARKGQSPQWVKKVQYMRMLAGIQKQVRNSGEVSSVEAHVIYEHDRFVWRQGIDGNVLHEPKFPGDRGKPIGAYAIAKFKDGSPPQFEVMDFDEIERVRAVSKAANDGPWTKWWGEMARKTVFRRLSKWLPLDADVAGNLSRDEDEIGLTNRQQTIIDGTVEATQPANQIGHSERLAVLEVMSAADSVTIDGEAGDDFPGTVSPREAA
jgi:recombination protein RecT